MRIPKWLVAIGLLGLAGLIALIWFAVHYSSFEASFARSRPAFEAYARIAMASDPSGPLPPLPRWLGEFGASSPERLPHGFLFFSDYGNWTDMNGFAYSTEPPSAWGRNRYDEFEHIAGNWYKVWRSWTPATSESEQ